MKFKEYNKLINDHTALKVDYDRILAENKELHLHFRKANNQPYKTAPRTRCERFSAGCAPHINSEEKQHLQCHFNVMDEKTIEIRKSKQYMSTISTRLNDIKEFTVEVF